VVLELPVLGFAQVLSFVQVWTSVFSPGTYVGEVVQYERLPS
jgi:hypothetical protein